jgi:hypothetical protein
MVCSSSSAISAGDVSGCDVDEAAESELGADESRANKLGTRARSKKE